MNQHHTSPGRRVKPTDALCVVYLGIYPLQRFSPLQLYLRCRAETKYGHAFMGHNKQTSRWSSRVIQYTDVLGNPKAESQLIGHETGLQGIFMGNPEGPVDSFGVRGLLSALETPYQNTPDSILMTGNYELKVVGELKVH